MNVIAGAALGEDAVFIGIRPERVRLSSDGEIRGRVSRVERTGADAYVSIATSAGTIVARVDAANVPDVGIELACGWEPQHVRRFDRVSGAALP